jgi:hypothetical protein
MAITSRMAKITVRSTFALDPQTVDSLDRLARNWAVSKSEALRRVVNVAAAVEEMDATSDALAALDELQQTLGMESERSSPDLLRKKPFAIGFVTVAVQRLARSPGESFFVVSHVDHRVDRWKTESSNSHGESSANMSRWDPMRPAKPRVSSTRPGVCAGALRTASLRQPP